MAARCPPKQALADLSLPILDQRRSAIRRSKAGVPRAIVLVLVQALIAVHVAHWMSTGRTMTPLEPSESMQFSQSAIVNAGLIFFALTILSTFVLGRWFCGWACHLVALQDGSRWLLEKIGLRPRPANLGILGAVPWAAFVYMFLAPLVQRLLHGEHLAAAGWRLTTDRFWATFPSWPVALATFLVCGFVIVYLLGAKGFCNYGCPYGAIFGIADQIAPLRIRVNDACEGCGHCTAVCTSNVRVHEEVRDFGAVVDPACMKCLDCVSVCPKDALRVGFGPPAILASGRKGTGIALLDLGMLGAFLAGCFAVFLDFDHDLETIPGIGALLAVLTAGSLLVAAVFRGKARRPREYSAAENALLGGFFLLAMYAVRGFRGSVPLLFALGLSSILAFLAVQGLRLLSRRDVFLQRHVLRSAGRWTAAGTLFAGALLPIGALWSYAGWSRHALRGSYEEGMRLAGDGRYEEALAALRRTVEIDPGFRDAQEKLAGLLCDTGRVQEGIAAYRAVLARSPDRLDARVILAGALYQAGDRAAAREEMERAVAIAPSNPRVHRMLAELLTALGESDAARREVEKAQELEAAPPR